MRQLRTLAATAAALSLPAALLAPAPHAAALGTAGRVSASQNCGDDVAVYAPPGGGWGAPSTGTCAVEAGGKNPVIYVSWSVPWWTNGQVCARARGFAWSTGNAIWQSLGCGTSGSAPIHWGKSGVGAWADREVEVEIFNTPGSGVPAYFQN